MEIISSTKPPRIAAAVNLLWATLAIGLAKSLMDAQHLSAQAPPAFVNYVLLAVFVLMALLILYISKGHNWARIAYLLLFLLGIMSVQTVFGDFVRSPVLGAFGVFQIVLQVAALYLLFTNPGKAWFKKSEPSQGGGLNRLGAFIVMTVAVLPVPLMFHIQNQRPLDLSPAFIGESLGSALGVMAVGAIVGGIFWLPARLIMGRENAPAIRYFLVVATVAIAILLLAGTVVLLTSPSGRI